MILENLFVHIFPRKSPKPERRAGKDQRKEAGRWSLAINSLFRETYTPGMAWGGRLQKDYTEKGEMDVGAGSSWVPGAGEMPSVLARSGQWPVPGTSTTREALVYVRRKVPMVIREPLRGLLAAPSCGSAAVTSSNSLSSAEPQRRNWEWEEGKRKLK